MRLPPALASQGCNLRAEQRSQMTRDFSFLKARGASESRRPSCEIWIGRGTVSCTQRAGTAHCWAQPAPGAVERWAESGRASGAQPGAGTGAGKVDGAGGGTSTCGAEPEPGCHSRTPGEDGRSRSESPGCTHPGGALWCQGLAPRRAAISGRPEPRPTGQTWEVFLLGVVTWEFPTWPWQSLCGCLGRPTTLRVGERAWGHGWAGAGAGKAFPASPVARHPWSCELLWAAVPPRSLQRRAGARRLEQRGMWRR